MSWGIRMVPPDAFTTIRDVPAVKPPANVSMERTVRMLPFAVSVPPAATVRESTVRGRLAPEVFRVVDPAASWIVRAWATSPEVAKVNVAVDDPALNTTALNSTPPRFEPAKVIVWEDPALKRTVPVP